MPSDSESRFLRELAHAPAERPNELTGRSVAHFDVVSKIGRGGMGVVYRAHDTKLDRHVALKVLRRVEGRGDEPQKRLLREARSAARLVHPAAAAVYEVGEFEGTAYIAMELVEGRSLRDQLSDGVLPFDEALRVAEEVAGALAHAHRLGIVHRDIKPDNIMITPSGAAKVLDFGLAKVEGSGEIPAAPAIHPELGSGDSLQTQAGRVMGTPGYMSPEQQTAGLVDARTDIYALGVVLREMLTGVRDAGPQTGSVLKRAGPIILRCTEHAASARYPDAQALVTALQAARRPKARTWPLGLAAVALSAGLTFVLWPQPPLQAPHSVLACPPLQARGVDAPVGWLGAAASDLACRRADVYLGNQTSRTLTPAQLLDAPTRLSKALPKDLYGEPDMRVRAVAAAKKRGQAWLDGSVEAQPRGFVVELVLRRDTSELMRASGEGELLFRAVARALDGLVAQGGIPVVPLLDEDVRWSFARDAPAVNAYQDLIWSSAAGMGQISIEECDAWDAARSGHERPQSIDFVCAQARGKKMGPQPVLELDESSAPALAFTAAAYFASKPNAPDGPALLERLRGMRNVEPSTAGRLALDVAALDIASIVDREEARLLALQISQEYPRWPYAHERVAGLMLRRADFPAALRAFQVWTPAMPDAWNMSTYGDPKATLDERVRMGLRAVVLGPQVSLYAGNLIGPLLAAGRFDDLQALTVRVRARGPAFDFDAETLQAAFEAGRARLDAANRRVMRALATHENLANLQTTDNMSVWLALQTASILGREHEVAAELATRFVLAEPPRLNPTDAYSSYLATLICLHADDDVLKPCAQRIRALDASGYFENGHSSGIAPYFQGLAAYADGDVEGLVRRWRPLTPNIRGRARRASLLSRVGRDDLAAPLERMAPTAMSLTFNGARYIDVQRAHRLAKDGKLQEAAALAERVITAWTSADADVPLLPELRRLTKRHAAQPRRLPQ